MSMKNKLHYLLTLMALSTRHLLGIKDLSPSDISLLVDTAKQFKEVLNRPVKKVPSLRDITIVNLFTKTLPAQEFRSSWRKSVFRRMSSTSVLRAHLYRRERRYWTQ